jgi:hypothetical protein
VGAADDPVQSRRYEHGVKLPAAGQRRLEASRRLSLPEVMSLYSATRVQPWAVRNARTLACCAFSPRLL